MLVRYTPLRIENMNPKAKKILFIALFALDLCLTVFFLVISIIMIATLPADKGSINQNTFIGYLQYNTTVFLLAVLVPLFLLLGVNIVVLIMYVRKTNKAKQVKLNELSAEEKEALRKELMKDLAGPQEPKQEKEE